MSHAALIEESHEAFYVWCYARAHGWIPSAPSTLLHVDQHASMSAPRLRRPLRDVQSLAEAKEFTYSECAVNNYLCPALYQGVFNRVVWLRRKPGGDAGTTRRIQIAAQDLSETAFRITSAPGNGVAAVEYTTAAPGEAVRLAEPWVLNLNLNFFCGTDEPQVRQQTIEVTENEYRSYCTDRYHFLRLAPLGCAVPSREGDRYYLTFGGTNRQAPAQPARSLVSRRIDAFVESLASSGVPPSLLVICRSHHSGYVPEELAAFTEDSLLRALNQLFPFRRHDISELYPESAVAEAAYA